MLKGSCFVLKELSSYAFASKLDKIQKFSTPFPIFYLRWSNGICYSVLRTGVRHGAPRRLLWPSWIFYIFGKVPKMAFDFFQPRYYEIFIANLEIFGFWVAYAIWFRMSRWSFLTKKSFRPQKVQQMVKIALNLNHMVFELLGFKMTSDRVGHIIKNDQREKILSRIFTKFAPIKNCHGRARRRVSDLCKKFY